MICPICRKDTRTADQIICAECKEKNPYNLLGGYSTTKSISEELKKVAPYEALIDKQKKLLKAALAAIVLLFVGLILSLVLGAEDQLPITAHMSDATEKLEAKIVNLEKQLSDAEQEIEAISEGGTDPIPNTETSLLAEAKQSPSAGMDSVVKELQLVITAKDAEVEALKSQVSELTTLNLTNATIQGKTSSQIHVVTSGESLSSIALKYYGSENKINVILSDNDISDADKIYVGQELKIRK